MPSPSVTYTFANSTTADATQVNQNFSDIINGITDGTKDLAINALTCAGAVSLNGNVGLGNASGDDVSFTGSLATSIPIKTTNSFDIGSSTLGLRALYFGANSQTVNIKGSASMSATWTLTLPTTAGTADYLLATDGAGATSWVSSTGGPFDVKNYSLTAAVASNELTINLKTADDNTPSTSNKVIAVFRSSTAATGAPVNRSVTSALNITVSSGASLGHASARDQYVYVYLIDNAGSVELAVSGTRYFDEGTLVTTTAMAGTATDGITMYSTNARTNVPFRYIGRLKSNQATAGTWATSISEIALNPSGKNSVSRSEVIVHSGNGHGSTNTKIRRWTTTQKNVGSAITYADSATAGASFTIIEDGLYYVGYLDAYESGAENFGVTVNSAELTTAFSSISTTGAAICATQNSANAWQMCSALTVLRAGDVVRCHTAGTANRNQFYTSRFQITQVASFK